MTAMLKNIHDLAELAEWLTLAVRELHSRVMELYRRPQVTINVLVVVVEEVVEV